MTSYTPLVSIIMAVKDTAPYLRECLDSILEQTYPHWELLAVNDHSADGSEQIIAEYSSGDSRIRLIENKGDKLIAALQTGYALSQGTLINRMDSDDKMPEDKLETMVDAWTELGVGHVVAGGTEHFVDQGEVGEGFKRYDQWLNEVSRNSRHFEEIYKECTIPSHCWLIHRNDFDKTGGFNSPVYPEDYDLCFRLYKTGLKVIGLDKVLHFWRDRADRISRTWEVYKDNRYFDLKIKYFFELDRNPERPLVLWGAGRNGKDLAKLLLNHEDQFHWACDNQGKVGKDIYGLRMQHFNEINDLSAAQILIAVSSPDGKKEIKGILDSWQKKPVSDYWFFC